MISLDAGDDKLKTIRPHLWSCEVQEKKQNILETARMLLHFVPQEVGRKTTQKEGGAKRRWSPNQINVVLTLFPGLFVTELITTQSAGLSYGQAQIHRQRIKLFLHVGEHRRPESVCARVCV